ncbi:protein modigliani isoform X2 [Drosophila bipectinata]|uniref:protein modigliani isoform X2 n=1 Tax=Drosophila bipectinata TaxID=42026 RepID=UPI0007E83355|nr:uncharacterized protein LOC108130887 isoform X2 [Drosophila bipectinata]
MNSEFQNILEFCTFFKHLLVEELALKKDYSTVHYGKCAVIGRLSRNTNQLRLENVRVKDLQEEYRLPEGRVSLPLLGLTRDKANEQHVSVGCYCIIRGEVVLVNLLNEKERPLTSRGVKEYISIRTLDGIARKQYLDDLLLSHIPAIDVWFAHPVDAPEDLLERKLRANL